MNTQTLTIMALIAAIAAGSEAQAAAAGLNGYVYAYTYPTEAGVAMGCSGADGDAIELHANRYQGAFVCGDIGDTHIQPVSLNGFILWLILP